MKEEESPQIGAFAHTQILGPLAMAEISLDRSRMVSPVEVTCFRTHRKSMDIAVQVRSYTVQALPHDDVIRTWKPGIRRG